MYYCLFSAFAQEGGPCDPGICNEIPGLVYNAETNECAWPDEVGCSLQGKSHDYSALLGTSRHFSASLLIHVLVLQNQ